MQSRHPFGIFHDDLFQHALINGQTGVGKSTILKILYANIVAQGIGCTLIDFNGDLADEATEITPPDRADNVIFCDLADLEYAIPTNPFYGVPRINHATFAEQFAATLQHIYKDSWGNRMNHLLKNTIRALLEAPEELRPTIYSITHVLSNKHYRKQIFGAAKDPELIAYYKNELQQKTPRELREYSEPIFNKIGDLTANPYILNAMSSYKPKLQFNNIIKNNSVLILRLPKGLIGNGAKLYGSLALSSIINEAYAQQSLPEEERVPHFILIDETLNVEHGCLVEPVSESRKYKLGLVASSQFTKQLHPELRDALLGNAGSIFSYRCAKDDAELFAGIMDEFHPRRFVDLKRGEAFVRLMKNGSPSAPFKAEIELADIPQHNAGELIRAVSQRQYSQSTKDIQTTFSRWVNKQMINPKERKQLLQKSTKQQRATTITKLDRHLPLPEGRTLTEAERHQRIKAIGDLIDQRGRNDPAWPKKLKLHKANRRRRRRPTYPSEAN